MNEFQENDVMLISLILLQLTLPVVSFLLLAKCKAQSLIYTDHRLIAL